MPSWETVAFVESRNVKASVIFGIEAGRRTYALASEAGIEIKQLRLHAIDEVDEGRDHRMLKKDRFVRNAPENQTVSADAQAILARQIQLQQKILEIGERSLTLTEERKHLVQLLIKSLENDQRDLILGGASAHRAPFGLLKNTFDQAVAQLEADSIRVRERLHHVFEFINAAFGDGQERRTLMSGLTNHPDSARFISRFGCDDYFAHSDDLKLFDRHQAILSAMADLQNKIARMSPSDGSVSGDQA